MADAKQKTKIAVLGGGMGSLAAAFELSNTPELRSRYEITVYQLGWRLGGKGASGRGCAIALRSMVYMSGWGFTKMPSVSCASAIRN
ncbi:MAG: NAD(P)-binding protein [Leptolyngbyaceae cyanobacterium RU_5_1]|nr:NAD(P)-binding protein [Leptolyngbyaceae cyanobacterium RU_5_1]